MGASALIVGGGLLAWAVGSGQWAVVSGQWSVVSGQWSVVSGQWSVVSSIAPLNIVSNSAFAIFFKLIFIFISTICSAISVESGLLKSIT
ncbi:hypothetical protein ACBQ04_11430 [Psychrobacter faecalis]